MAAEADCKYMKLALELAEKARGKTSPNPLVGAVIVKGNRIVGQGYHKKAGTPHAEVVALAKAGNRARGATLYVNLEPCCHFGRTSPCTREIIKSGIKQVVYSVKDANPNVNGKGARELKRAGIKIRSGILRNEAIRLNEVYFKNIKTGRPFVVLKIAQSLDGKIATATGDSQWITGKNSRKFVHRLRAVYDAVAVGAGTVRADDPELTVRLVKGDNPYRIIISSKLDFPANSVLLKNNDDCKTIVATSLNSTKKLGKKNLTVWKINALKNGLSLADFLDKAARFGITSILIEGGAGLATSFVRRALVDKFHFIMAPTIIGRGKDALNDLKVRKLNDAYHLKDVTIEESGRDLIVTGYPED
jgi:diaminohydroxyphosphoribosylaminopyrimidine deaminase/5-amino-6-(5-phosphoribosylamino)uracil reductase